MPELIRATYQRATRTQAVAYGWSTYARRVLADTMPEHGSCGGSFIAAHPTGRVDRYTYRADLKNENGQYGRWMLTGTATVDQNGNVTTAKDITS